MTAIATTVLRKCASENFYCRTATVTLTHILVDPRARTIARLLIGSASDGCSSVEPRHGMKVHGQSVRTGQDVDHTVRKCCSAGRSVRLAAHLNTKQWKCPYGAY